MLQKQLFQWRSFDQPTVHRTADRLTGEHSKHILHTRVQREEYTCREQMAKTIKARKNENKQAGKWSRLENEVKALLPRQFDSGLHRHSLWTYSTFAAWKLKAITWLSFHLRSRWPDADRNIGQVKWHHNREWTGFRRHEKIINDVEPLKLETPPSKRDWPDMFYSDSNVSQIWWLPWRLRKAKEYELRFKVSVIIFPEQNSGDEAAKHLCWSKQCK